MAAENDVHFLTFSRSETFHWCLMYFYHRFTAPGFRKPIVCLEGNSEVRNICRQQTHSRMPTISRNAVKCASRMEPPWILFDAAIVFAETCKKKGNDLTPLQGVHSNICGKTSLMFAWSILSAIQDFSRHWLQFHSVVCAQFQLYPTYREGNNPHEDFRREDRINTCTG